MSIQSERERILAVAQQARAACHQAACPNPAECPATCRCGGPEGGLDSTEENNTHERRRIMAYTVRNFKTKKELREALKRGEAIEVYQPGPFGPAVRDGRCTLEGPHYPEPHKWYASCVVKSGRIVRGTLR